MNDTCFDMVLSFHCITQYVFCQVLYKIFVCYNRVMVTAKIITNHIFRHDKKADILHSSGYARAQSGDNIGAASGTSFNVRRGIEEHRKFIKGYRNSKIMNDFYGVERAKYFRANSMDKQKQADNDSSQKNPVNSAMRRAQYKASDSRQRGKYGAMKMPGDSGAPSSSKTPGVGAANAPSGSRGAILPNAKAPQIPTHFGGI